MLPWEQPLPPFLYKYVRPERLGVLLDCRIRFSQRTAFEDDRELQPEYATFGTEDEIRRFVSSGGMLPAEIPPDEMVRTIATDARYQARALEVAKRTMRSPDEFGVLCLTELADSEQMWREYAGRVAAPRSAKAPLGAPPFLRFLQKGWGLFRIPNSTLPILP